MTGITEEAWARLLHQRAALRITHRRLGRAKP